jgi:hypothetical protein
MKSVKARLYTSVRQAIIIKNAKILFMIEKFILLMFYNKKSPKQMLRGFLKILF